MGRLSANWLKREGYNDTQVLIETGTKDGVSLSYCATIYPEVHGIELDPQKYGQAKIKLAVHPNARVHFGDSRRLLPKIIDPSKSTTFFLDAHYVPTDKTIVEPADHSALLGELKIIMAAKWRVPPRILIDDAWMFMVDGWRTRRRAGYKRGRLPTEQQILEIIGPHGYALSVLVTGNGPKRTDMLFLATREVAA